MQSSVDSVVTLREYRNDTTPSERSGSFFVCDLGVNRRE